MPKEYDETIRKGQTLDLTYYISENENDIIYDDKITVDEDVLKNTDYRINEKLLWTPDENDVDETYTFKIGEKKLSIKVIDMPDNGLQHEYDSRQLTGFSQDDVVTSFDDIVADNNLLASGEPTYQEDELEGSDAVQYNSIGDVHEGDGMDSGENSEYTIAFVVKPTDVSNRERFNGVESDIRAGVGWDNGEWEAHHMGQIATTGGSISAGQAYAGVQTYDGSDKILQIGDDVIVNTSADIESGEDFIQIGDAGGNEPNVIVGHTLFYDQFYDAEGRDDIISWLETSWGFDSPDATS